MKIVLGLFFIFSALELLDSDRVGAGGTVLGMFMIGLLLVIIAGATSFMGDPSKGMEDM